MDFQEFSLSLGVKRNNMGKRLTPEEREARIKAYEEAKAAKQAARAAKRLERAKVLEERKAKREREKKGPKPKEYNDSTKVGYVKSLPPFKGKLEVGDEVGFRFLGMAMPGKIIEYQNEVDYHDDANLEEGQEPRRGRLEFYIIKGPENTVYPIKKTDILCKKVNGVWKEKA